MAGQCRSDRFKQCRGAKPEATGLRRFVEYAVQDKLSTAQQGSTMLALKPGAAVGQILRLAQASAFAAHTDTHYIALCIR
jgi:hypothetical protein